MKTRDLVRQSSIEQPNAGVARWRHEGTNERGHGTTREKPVMRAAMEVAHLQALMAH